MQLRLVTSAVPLVFCLACSGNLPSASVAPPTHVVPAFTPQTAATGGLRRLTVQQYQNTVLDLLGPTVQFNVVLEADPTYPGTLGSEAASTVVTSFFAAQQFDLSAHDLAAQMFADPNQARAFVGCTPSLNENDPCVPSFIESFGSRAWRMPLSARAQSAYTAATYAFAADPNNGVTDPNQAIWYGLEQVVATMLQSPYFLYRTELGTPSQNGNWRTLSNYEVASRLSYLLWNTMPDATLMDAAAAGDLTTMPGVAAQVERMLASPRTQSSLTAFFEEWLQFNTLDSLTRDPNLYPQFTPTLGHSMRLEFDKDVASIALDPNANFLDLLTSNQTYVNADLASLYGLSPVADNNTWVRVTLPQSSHRAGLLTMGGFLATQAHPSTTAPVLRGKFVLSNLMCTTIGPPPDNAGQLPPPVTGSGHQTMRQQLQAHATNPSCGACHNLMDPPGLSLENFDGIGAYRDTDEGLPIDASGVIGETSFTGGVALGQVVHDMPQTQACAVRQFYRQALGQPEPTDPNALHPLVATFGAGGNNFRNFVRAFAMSDAFRYVQGIR